MTRLFIVAAACWAFIVGTFVRFDPHALLAHWFTVLWVTVLLAGQPIAWRWLEQYRVTASVAARIDAAEGRVLAKLILLLEGVKSALLMAIVSAFATAKDWVSTTVHALFGLAPDDLDPFKDSTLLHAFFSDGVALKAIAGVSIFAAFLSIKGKLFAARIVPAADPAAPAAPSATPTPAAS